MPSALIRRQNFAFARQHLASAPSRVLEVGCGDGDVARDLVQEGFEVTAIDSDRAAVATAKAKGVRAVAANFLEFDAEPFEAVLFTRSLHHISPLDEALAHAGSLLLPKGTLVVDDFAVEEMDAPTAVWFYGQLEVLTATGLPLGECHVGASDPQERWRLAHQHDPPLHTGRELRRGVEAHFDPILVKPVAYLYRYFHGWLKAIAPCAEAVVQSIFRTEQRLVRTGVIRPLGLQLVARRRDQEGTSVFGERRKSTRRGRREGGGWEHHDSGQGA